MKNIWIAIVLVLFSFSLFAQEPGAITLKMLQGFQQKTKNSDIKALQNAVTHNPISKLALNQEAENDIDKYFKYRVETNGISNQKASGRCWLYTGLNTLKPIILSKNNLSTFEFSQSYNFFYDQLEKANLFLEGIIASADLPLDDRRVEWWLKNPIGDGGQWTTFADIVKKYGVVPKSVMPETYSSENTRYMSKFLAIKLKKDALILRDLAADKTDVTAMRKTKEEMLADIYKLLVINLGQPPSEFQWRFKDKTGQLSELKTYTPQSFYAEAVGINLDDYVMFMNDPTRPYYKLYEVEYDRNLAEGINWKYINLPAEDIKAFALASIKNNEAMYFSCDVGKYLDKKRGVLDVNNFDYDALFDMEFGMDKKARIETFSSASTHGMALIGADVDQNEKTVKWLLENSWGATAGYHGYLIMTDKWFDEYMFRIVVNRKYVSSKVLKILDQKPTLLPPWDPMFAPEE